MKDSHLSFLFSNGLLLAAVDVLKALQEGQQRGAGSLCGAFVVHLSGATFPKAQQQQNSRQQLTGRVNIKQTKWEKSGEKTGIKWIQLVFFTSEFPSGQRVPGGWPGPGAGLEEECCLWCWRSHVCH